ncbi:hypothetical protein SKAU_G00319760 [Synaphobranchus kaupii]|uniref:Uncharacterized protein n=1 Tax=Synaphobranchus kaupii TaxID=118154 RepID=A0A9Q1ENI9_SYNKA|nr:hypothetical protein SKAU_G00319760 [Synaphobranchus kaupii]
MDEFSTDEPDEFSDDLLEVLSSQCDIPVSSLNLSQLTADELGQIISVLDSLLFEKWMNARPPHKTLKHAQVFLTQMCILSLETSEGVSLQSVSTHVQYLVETISQSAANTFEDFLLTQALYLSLVHFFTDHDDSGNDAVQIARRWAEGDLSAETLFVLNFLCTVTESLQKVVGMASVFVLNMEVQCLRLLFSTLTNLNVDTNTNKTKDTDRKKCYQKDIVYGTVETYAADHLRQTFEMKDVRPDRGYDCIIIDEVDLLLLDQGIQVTYLSSPMVSMQHLNIILTMIWGHVHQTGRAALVICETINKVNDLYEELKDSIPGEVIIYTRSDINSLGTLSRKLNPGDVVLATNLAGRGTNIKVTKEVNANGGLFVILSFLSDNARVERQAFGRTARKGKPGSAQIIMSTDHLQECYRIVSSVEEAKTLRDSLAVEKIQDMQNDIDEMKLREDLFSEYCKTLQEIHENTDKDEQKAVVPIMNEFWGIWLQTKSDEIDQLKRTELQQALRADLALAKQQSETQNSPSSNIYHYVKFGHVAMKDKKWDVSIKLFQKAMNQDASWAAIAFYNHAYCIIKQQSGGYLTKATDDLKKAQDSLKYFSEECMAGLNFIKMSLPKSAEGETSSLEKQFTTKCNMLSYLNKNMNDAIKKLDEIKGKGRDALAKKAPVFTLVSDSEEELQMETFNLYDRGLHYIFSVDEEPRFPWEALVVFLLGVLQIIGGALLTAFTFGALAQVDLGWQNQLNSSIIKVLHTIKQGAGGKTKAILIAIQVTHMGILAADAVSSVITLSDKFFDGLSKGLEDFKNRRAAPQKVKASDLSDSENKMLNDFKKEIINTISTLLAKALVQVFHQKFSSHLVSQVQNKVNGAIGDYVSSGLNTKRMAEKLKAAQESTYNAHMPGDAQAGGSGEQSKSHAEKVKNTEMTGSNVDIKVLSEATGTKVVIVREDKDGKLTKLQEMNPSTDDASQTVTLIYRPKSDQHPEGHYDVQINNKIVSVEKGDVYHAMAHGMKPDASKEDIASAADNLRAKEAEALEKKPTHFESFIQRDVWIKEVMKGSWKIAEGVEKKNKILNAIKKKSEEVTDQSQGTTQIINGVKQPPKHIISASEHFTTGSKLSKAMFEVAADSSDHAQCQLPVVYAPYERNNKFPTAESPELKRLLAQTISKDDVEGTFKLTIIGATPTFMLERKHFLNEDMSLTRLDTFEHSFPERAKELVNTWFKLLESKTDLMKSETKETLENWINGEGYLNPNDAYRKQITSSI